MAMTARQIWEGMLTELSKSNAPAILLSDFNYFINKAVNQYINKRYNIYDVNQQTTDDLRVLKATTFIPANKVDTPNIENNDIFKNAIQSGAGSSKLLDGFYEVILPLDYLHLLNCTCYYRLNERFKCYNANDIVEFSAKRLTGDTWSTVINNYWTRPAPERPYYYIHNVNSSIELPTNPVSNTDVLDRTVIGTDAKEDYTTYDSTIISYKLSDGTTKTQEEYNNLSEDKKKDLTINEIITSVKKENNGSSNLPRRISIKGVNNQSLVEREAGVRYGNSTNVRMEIRYGQKL